MARSTVRVVGFRSCTGLLSCFPCCCLLLAVQTVLDLLMLGFWCCGLGCFKATPVRKVATVKTVLQALEQRRQVTLLARRLHPPITLRAGRVSRSPVHPQRANKVSHKGASSKNDKQRVLAGWPHGREQTFLSCGPDSSHPTCYVAHSPFAAGNSWQQHVACKRRSEGSGFFKLLPRAFAITNSASTALFRPAKHSTYRALYLFSQCQPAAVNMR